MKELLDRYKVYVGVVIAILIGVLIFSVVNGVQRHYKKIEKLNKKIKELEREAHKNEVLADYEREMRKGLQDSLDKVRLGYKEIEDKLKDHVGKKPKPEKLGDAQLQKWFNEESSKYTKLRGNGKN
jgi:predicted nucleotide-binding protein (sugar kinase/HSP70/actin superfamily)